MMSIGRHVAVLILLTALAYVAIAFFGVPGDLMIYVPLVFLAYLALWTIVRRSTKGRSRRG